MVLQNIIKMFLLVLLIIYHVLSQIEIGRNLHVLGANFCGTNFASVLLKLPFASLNKVDIAIFHISQTIANFQSVQELSL